MDDQAAQKRSLSTAAVAPDSSQCRRQCMPDMQSLGLPPHIMAMLPEEDLSALASAKASVERCCSTKNPEDYIDRVVLCEEIGLLKEQWFRCQKILAGKMDEKGSWDVEWMCRAYAHLYDEPPYVGVVDRRTGETFALGQSGEWESRGVVEFLRVKKLQIKPGLLSEYQGRPDRPKDNQM